MDGRPNVAILDQPVPADALGTCNVSVTITGILNRLEQLVADHGDWLKELHLKVLCRTPAGSNDLDLDALLHPAAWHDLLASPVFDQCQARGDVLVQLASMAERARITMAAAKADDPAFAEQYDQFMSAVLTFLSAVRRLQSETWNLLANVDALTGLGNRQAMIRRLSVECERHARGRQPCSIAMIDLDRFKPINDRYGHAVGDVVLSQVAGALADSIRPYDAVFRYGGDEFSLCLPSTDTRSAWAIVERLRLKIAAMPIVIRDGDVVRTSLSVGIAPLTCETGVKVALETADLALYRAKNNGRNGIFVATTSFAS